MAGERLARESDAQREDRYWEIVGSGAYFPEGWEMPHLTSPPESSMPGAADRARMQVEALKSAEFESTHPPERTAWSELSEWSRFDNLRHWVDWDGVSRDDRARLIGGQLNAYELAVARIPSHEYCTAIDMPELMEFWERLDPANQKRFAEMPSLAELKAFTEAVANLRTNGAPDEFDRIVANLPHEWRHDGHADSGKTWEDLNAVDKTGYLAEHGARHKVSFERFVDATSRTLGLASWEQFTADDIGQLLEQYRDTVERQRSEAAQPAARMPELAEDNYDRHLDPNTPGRDDWMSKLSIDDQSRKELAAELDRIKRDTYVDAEEQATGSMYTRGEGGYPFHELPVVECESLIEDYVDWGKYMERGLTFADQGRVMHEAARDPLPRETPTSPEGINPSADYQKALGAAADRGSNKGKEGLERDR